jgi:hypothetical protein
MELVMSPLLPNAEKFCLHCAGIQISEVHFHADVGRGYAAERRVCIGIVARAPPPGGQ